MTGREEGVEDISLAMNVFKETRSCDKNIFYSDRARVQRE